ncbi:MAG TPA: SDR family oxidoreductase [Dongiaceae bacterium]|jgi:NAD(P)-dependent dehydrogenase (short-subunit alcohol dehydrogenase family)|nr:SDR family oxidoreductase [Dongiaceae bacterium]
MHDLSDKTILVTGASKGIGAAIIAALGREGAHVIGHYGSDEAGARAATAGIAAERVRLVAGDLAKPGEPARIWRDALAWRGRIDVLVNNAAMMAYEGGIDDTDEVWERIWAETLQVNVKAPADLLRGAVRHFRKSGGGTIITISSWNAQRGSTNPVTIAYAASKAAVMAATKTIARGYAKENILAYIVAPGVVRTRLSENFAATQGGEQVVTASLAMGEWVPPGDIAELVVFLATGRCRHLTGATLDVNGASYVR